MTPLGDIKDIVIPEATMDQLNQLPETFKLRALFSKQGMSDILGASAIVLPDEQLSKGQSWSDEAETSTTFGVFNRKRNYTFVGINQKEGREVAEFSLVATLEPVVDDSETQKGDSLKGQLVEFSGDGKLFLDVEGGFFSSSSIRNEARSEKPYREKKIQTVVANQMKMTVVKK